MPIPRRLQFIITRPKPGRNSRRRVSAGRLTMQETDESMEQTTDRGATAVPDPANPSYVHPLGDARTLNEEELKRLTKEQLVSLARHEELPNRSKMNKAQLARTLRKHFRASRS